MNSHLTRSFLVQDDSCIQDTTCLFLHCFPGSSPTNVMRLQSNKLLSRPIIFIRHQWFTIVTKDRKERVRLEETQQHFVFQRFSSLIWPLKRVDSAMSRRSSLLAPDLSVLPANLLELKDDAFYDLVQKIISSDEAELLRVQSVRTIHSFMRVNVPSFFHLNADDLVPLQSRLAHKKTDGKYVVHLGVRGHIIYLTELFTAFKKPKAKAMQTNGNTSIGVINTTSMLNDSTSSQSIPSSDQSANGTPPAHHLTTTAISCSAHRAHVQTNIRTWWHSFRDKQKIHNQTLLEPDDYKLTLDESSCTIICSCGTSVVIRRPSGRRHYQLSNYYQHIVGSEKCDLMKRKQRDQQQEDDSIDAHSATSLRLTTSEQPVKRRSSSTLQQKSKKTRTQ